MASLGPRRHTLHGRGDLVTAKRVVVKVGTSTVSRADGSASLGRIGHLVEQLTELHLAGKEVMLVSSGAVGVGRGKLRKQQLFSRSVQSSIGGTVPAPPSLNACAAAGQSGVMGLYEQLFGQYDVLCAQVLVSPSDFGQEAKVEQLKRSLLWLLDNKTIPVLNENDAISAHRSSPPGTSPYFTDNDGLAAVLAQLLEADVLLLLSDVDGIYRKMPAPGEKPDVIDVYSPRLASSISIGSKSAAGRGGMGSKIEAALTAIRAGVGCVVIASGYDPSSVSRVMNGEAHAGTMIVLDADDEPAINSNGNGAAAVAAAAAAAAAVAAPPPAPGAAAQAAPPSSVAAERAAAVRAASRQLQRLSGAERSALLRAIANALLANAASIEAANKLDIAAADAAGMSGALAARLHLPAKKLQTVVDGIRALADKPNPLGRVRARTRVADGLELLQESVAIGVLLVIFESRPDVLPQVSALALVTGNGLLLKGGKEAAHTNRALHAIIAAAIGEATEGRVDGAIVTLLEDRSAVDGLLTLHKEIDLVIPRGGAALVQHVMRASTIPVLGHADGICHVYVDKAAALPMAGRLILDAKLDYPAACNAAETALLHVDLVGDGRAQALLDELRAGGVALVGGPRACAAFALPAAESLHVEYGDNTLCVEIVDSVDDAVTHIARWGSGHTEVIVTEDAEAAASFLAQVDSACVFHNASSRFADGFRFGLGCEVGISTSRIHARGPVGLEGLLTMRWRLVSAAGSGHTVGDFSAGVCQYIHESLQL